MKLDEHQSKLFLSGADIPVPPGELISPSQAASYRSPYPFPVMLKAQVLQGKRGKRGAIRPVNGPAGLLPELETLFRMQIGDERVPLVRIEPKVSFRREFYLSFAVSRAQSAILFTVAKQGGMDVESLESKEILVQRIHDATGLQNHQIRSAFFHLEAERTLWPAFDALCRSLHARFRAAGLLLAEINPLVQIDAHHLLALDGKVEIDDNFAALTPSLDRYRQTEHVSSWEREAQDAGLSYHQLNGSVGLMANGAGLAMATMDILNDCGMPPANFLDLGGGADVKRIGAALSILFRHEGVRTVFINLFGGILSCGKAAEAIATVLDGHPPKKPVVIRFSGNGAPQGRDLLHRLNLEGLALFDELGQALEHLAVLNKGTPPSQSRPVCGHPAASAPGAHAKRPGPLALLGPEAGVLVQGLTGREGGLHAKLMAEYGTRIVAGVTPFKGGQSVAGVPVYDSVDRALRQHEVAASVIFVPGRAAADAVLEAVQAGIPWIVCITEGIPQQDMLRLLPVLARSNSRLVGPNTPGVIVPGAIKLGIMPGSVFSPGPVAVLSRSGTLTYECVNRLSTCGIGQSLCLGVGGDPFVGSSFVDICRLLETDDRTRAVLLLGEIGGRAEEEVADYVGSSGFSKPVVGFIAGRSAPPGKRLGHAGAILDGDQGGIDAKLEAMRQSGFTVCTSLWDIPAAVADALSS